MKIIGKVIAIEHVSQSKDPIKNGDEVFVVVSSPFQTSDASGTRTVNLRLPARAWVGDNDMSAVVDFVGDYRPGDQIEMTFNGPNSNAS